MAETRPLRDQQMEFAAYLRDPNVNPAPPNIEERRLKVYRELFFGSISSLLSSTFPVLRQLYSDGNWQTLVRGFYSTHRSHTPIFMEIPREFLDYLQNEHSRTDHDPIFLLELAHYEWVELALSIANDPVDWQAIDRNGDLMAAVPVRSPYSQSLAYSFAVHRINKDYQPTEPGAEPTRLIVYRDLQDEVGFLETNDVTARLVALMDEHPNHTGKQLLEIVGDELSHPNLDTVLAGGMDILNRLRRHDVLLGTRR